MRTAGNRLRREAEHARGVRPKVGEHASRPDAIVSHRAYLREGETRSTIVRSGGKVSYMDILQIDPAPGRPGECHALIRLLTRLFPQATRFQFADHTLTSRKSQAVAIDDEAALPAQWLSVKTTSQPDKAAI